MSLNMHKKISLHEKNLDKFQGTVSKHSSTKKKVPILFKTMIKVFSQIFYFKLLISNAPLSHFKIYD